MSRSFVNLYVHVTRFLNTLIQKFGESETGDEKESVGSEMLPPSGLPPYQKLVMHFLDKKAPALGKCCCRIGAIL